MAPQSTITQTFPLRQARLSTLPISHMKRTIASSLPVLLWLFPSTGTAARSLQIVSPLQTLTIWDKPPSTPRSRFLPGFKAGLEAEAVVRQKAKEAASTNGSPPTTAVTGEDWAQQAAAADQRRHRQVEQAAATAFQQAFDAAEAEVRKKIEEEQIQPRSSTYQFVGVVNSPRNKEDGPVTWYARPRPADATWSVRLVHINRRAILYDLFRRGKVDIFAKYKNQGKVLNEDGLPTRKPVIQAEYSVRERSWKNLWNFSPKHVFTDSSGMFWRERRLRPGLYTDGETVYEASYRYSDGRNGMYRRSTLDQYLESPNVKDKQKQRLLDRLERDSPDLVLEE